jgi:hypothetical protein
LFHNMPLHVDEQHGRHGVGSLAELISNEPLRGESHVSESDLSALQAVEAGEIVREAVIARTDASRSQHMVHEADGAHAHGRRHTVVFCTLINRPHAVRRAAA